MPANTINLADDQFQSPVAAFQALQISTRDKTFVEIRSMDQKLNPLQFMMQLRGFSHILETAAEDETHFGGPAIEICQQYLEEWRFSPFATSRLWTKELRAAAYKTRPPSKMYWVDKQTLQINSATILIPKYCQFLKEELNSLHEFLRTVVMFNMPDQDFEKICNPESLGTETGHPSPGNNPLFPKNASLYGKDSSAFLLNQHAIDFAVHVAKQQHLGLDHSIPVEDILAPTAKSTQVKWNHDKCHKWLSRVHTAWERAYCLYHTTSGLPARVTEEVSLRMTHSNLGPTNIFIASGKLQTRSDYSKTSTTSGLHKCITRALHPQLSHIFLVLLMCIRPLELQVLKGIDATDGSLDLEYTTMLFASWGKVWDSKGAGEVFTAWLRSGFGVELKAGIALYRQFATSLQRQWLQETDHSIRTNPEQGTESDESQFEAVSQWWQTNLQLN